MSGTFCDFCVFGHLCRVPQDEECEHFAPLDDWQIGVEEEETVREAVLDAWFSYTDPDSI